MHLLSSGPGKPEKSDWNEDTSDHGGVQAVLGRHDAILISQSGLCELLAVDQTVYEDDGDRGKDAANANRQESEAGLLDVEVVDGREDQRKSGEKRIWDGEVESDVPSPGDDDWLANKHGEWPEERDVKQELESGQTCRTLWFFEAE